ncbi:MAG: cytidylate kinase-like family protein [Anaerolineae bacterium]
MAVITVSRQRGSMGSYIALEVARELDLHYLDREIIHSVAREAGVEAKDVRAIEERAGRLARTLHFLGARPKLPSVASASLREQAAFDQRIRALMDHEHLSHEEAVARLGGATGGDYIPRLDYLDLVTSVILERAAQGQAMIVGRGGQMILRDRPEVLHVQIIARFETRVYNVIQRENVKWREAAHRVRLADEQRAGYMRRFYNIDWLDSSYYDLVISTDQLPGDVAVDLIVRASQAIEEAASDTE